MKNKFLLIFISLLLNLTTVAYAVDQRVIVYDRTSGKNKILADGSASQVLKTDGAGTVSWGTDSGGSGSGTSVIQEGDVSVASTADTLDFGTGFDLTESPANEANVTLDLTEFNAITWGDSSQATNTWTFALSGATDPTMTLANNLVTFNTPVVAGGSNSKLTGSNSIIADFSVTDYLTLSGGKYLTLLSTTTPAQTTNGSISWDSDDYRMTIGDGTNTLSLATKTKTRSFVVGSPATGSDFVFWQTKYGIVITAVSAICSGGTNVVGQLQEYNGTAGSATDVDSADWTITTSEYTDASFTNASIDAGDWVGWKTTSVSATVNFLSVTFEYYEV
jgi:hypothetical protein